MDKHQSSLRPIGTPAPADGVPVMFEERSKVVLPTRTSAQDMSNSSILVSWDLVTKMMSPGIAQHLKYDHEAARQRINPNKTKTTNNDLPQSEKNGKEEKSSTSEKEDNPEAKTVMEKTQDALNDNKLVKEANRILDLQEESITTPFVRLTCDSGKSEGRPFSNYMYFDPAKKKIVFDASKLHNPHMQKMLSLQHSSTYMAVNNMLEDQNLKSEAFMFFSMMFFSPTYVCTPGLYVLLTHQEQISKSLAEKKDSSEEKPNIDVSEHPSVISVLDLYRYYRTLFTVIGSILKETSPEKYEKIFKKLHSEISFISEIRSKRFRETLNELVKQASFHKFTRETQSGRSLNEWCKLPASSRLATRVDDQMFRYTVFYLNSLELALCDIILCIDAQKASDLCTPMLRPLLSSNGMLSVIEKEKAKIRSVNCLQQMCALYETNQLKNSEMVKEGKHLKKILEREKISAFIDDDAPLSLDGVIPKAFYFLRICAWIRMKEQHENVVIKP